VCIWSQQQYGHLQDLVFFSLETQTRKWDKIGNLWTMKLEPHFCHPRLACIRSTKTSRLSSRFVHTKNLVCVWSLKVPFFSKMKWRCLKRQQVLKGFDCCVSRIVAVFSGINLYKSLNLFTRTRFLLKGREICFLLYWWITQFQSKWILFLNIPLLLDSLYRQRCGSHLHL